jgi:hypothetical protein
MWVKKLVSGHKERTHRLWMFENRMLRKIFGLKREEVTGRERYIMRSSIIYTLHNMLLG